MKKIIMAVAVVMSAGLAGCEQNVMMEYENSPAIYFTYNDREIGGQRRSKVYSFFLEPYSVVRDTVWVEVSTMGLTSTTDRRVSVVQTNIGKEGAAEAGVHYVGFDNADIAAKMVVPAGAVHGRIPVVVLRDASLETKEVTLEMAVTDNENFRPGIDMWRNFTITITALTSKPNSWDEVWAGWFGTWGPRKFHFIMEVTQFYDWENPPSDLEYRVNMELEVHQRFLEYNREHPDPDDDPDKIKYEANGDRIVFL